MKFSIKSFLSKYDQIRSFLQIWLHLLKKYLPENFIFCTVSYWICAFASKSLITAVFTLTLPTPCMSENNIKIKINSNFYFHTSLRCLQRFYEGYEAFLYWEEWVEKSLISAEKRPQ